MIGIMLVASLSVGCDGGTGPGVGEDDAPVCVGVTPPEGSSDQAAAPLRELDEDGVAVDPAREAPIEPGEASPPWVLTDFQPQSCGDGSTYGMESFQGHVTVVALLAAW